jgi:hypothetical protein
VRGIGVNQEDNPDVGGKAAQRGAEILGVLGVYRITIYLLPW